MFYKRFGSDIIIAQIYVDDIVFCSTSQDRIDQFVKVMEHEFEMSMIGELTFFLGLQIKQCDDGIFISQSNYVKNMLKKFDMVDCKSARTPSPTHEKISRDDVGQSVTTSHYRGMIGSLLYLTASRPDICYSVGVCARYQADPKESHLKAVKRILKYVKGTQQFGLWYCDAPDFSFAYFIVRNSFVCI